MEWNVQPDLPANGVEVVAADPVIREHGAERPAVQPARHYSGFHPGAEFVTGDDKAVNELRVRPGEVPVALDRNMRLVGGAAPRNKAIGDFGTDRETTERNG